MTCRSAGGCGFEFCWICLGDYHCHSDANCSQALGDKRIAKLLGRQIEKTTQQRSLSSKRFEGVYHRWLGHENLIKAMKQSEKDFRHAMMSTDATTGAAQSTAKVLLAAAEEVCRSRSILKWAYVLSYFRSEGNVFSDLVHGERALLEDLVDELQRLVEVPKEMIRVVASRRKASRTEIQNAMQAVLRSAEMCTRVEDAFHRVQQARCKFLRVVNLIVAENTFEPEEEEKKKDETENAGDNTPRPVAKRPQRFVDHETGRYYYYDPCQKKTTWSSDDPHHLHGRRVLNRRSQRRPDWECTRCTFINKGHFRSCQMCDHQPTKAELSNKRKGKAAPKPPTEDWACTRCTFINVKLTTVCIMCDNAYVPKEKPTEKKVTSATEVEEEDPVEAINAEIEWRCLLCETVNDLSEEEKQASRALDPSSFQLGEASANQTKPRATISRCRLCDTPRITNKEIERHMKIVLQTRNRSVRL